MPLEGSSRSLLGGWEHRILGDLGVMAVQCSSRIRANPTGESRPRLGGPHPHPHPTAGEGRVGGEVPEGRPIGASEQLPPMTPLTA